MKPLLSVDAVREAVARNSATSYGLTLIVGLPLPSDVTDRIVHAQSQIERTSPARFTWYGPKHLHVTLLALLRGRYREAPCLQRVELPANLDAFVCDLSTQFENLQPFPIVFSGIFLTDSGVVVVQGTSRPALFDTLADKFAELDRPLPERDLHVSIGFLNNPSTPASLEEQHRLERIFDPLSAFSIGRYEVKRVSLVHYANRTLNRVLGQVHFDLGVPHILTAARMLDALGISC